MTEGCKSLTEASACRKALAALTAIVCKHKGGPKRSEDHSEVRTTAKRGPQHQAAEPPTLRVRDNVDLIRPCRHPCEDYKIQNNLALVIIIKTPPKATGCSLRSPSQAFRHKAGPEGTRPGAQHQLRFAQHQLRFAQRRGPEKHTTCATRTGGARVLG